MIFITMLIFSLMVMAGCQSETDMPAIAFSELDMTVADAGSGEKLFNQSAGGLPTCASCHMLDDSSGGIGPSFAGLAARAGSRVSGQSAEEYLYWSIVRPARYLVPGYSNVMFEGYDEAYVSADIADLIAYLLTLE